MEANSYIVFFFLGLIENLPVRVNLTKANIVSHSLLVSKSDVVEPELVSLRCSADLPLCMMLEIDASKRQYQKVVAGFKGSFKGWSRASVSETLMT